MRKEEIAEGLLSIQAVFLRPKDPFTWASGIHSPIYCDNRLTLSFPEVRRKIEAGLAELVSLIDDGKRILPIDSRYPLHQCKDAFKRLESRRSKDKVMLEF